MEIYGVAIHREPRENKKSERSKVEKKIDESEN